MAKRSCKYVATAAVKSCLSEAAIEDMVKATVDKLYDRNLELRERAFANRFNVFLVDGRHVNGGELLEALRANPDAVTQELPIVLVVEEGHEDIAHVMLQSEVGEDSSEAVKAFLAKPPGITLEQLKNHG